MTRTHKLKHLFIPHHSNNQRAKLLHPSAILVVIGFFLGFQILLRTTASKYPEVLGYSANIPVSEIINLTNQERQSRGLPTLKTDPQLTEAAAKKAADMFSKNYWAHVSPVGTQPWFFITDAGYTYRYAGENLARDFTAAPDVVKAWIASPTHKENLLSNRYQDIGVAVVDGNLNGHETTLVVQMFGTKLASASQPTVPKTSSFTVKAADAPAPGNLKIQPVEPVKSTPAVISQFNVNQYFVYILLGVFILVILVDIFIVYKKSLMRWTSKSLAHLLFFSALILAIAGILRGQII